MADCVPVGLLTSALTHRREHPDMSPPEGQPSAPDFEKELSRDPHEANIPVYPGLNVKSQVPSYRGRILSHLSVMYVLNVVAALLGPS